MGKVLRSLHTKYDVFFFLLFLVLFLFCFKDFFFAGNAFYERDSNLLEIPARKHCTQLLKEGGFALWTDAYGNGQPFLANPKNAVLYPSTWLYLVFPFFLAFKLHYLFHFIIAWLGLFYLGKSYRLSSPASFLAACVFVFSGMFLSSVEFYNHIAALSWMPWILLALHRLEGSFFSKSVKISFLWALLILAGTPYVILVTLIIGMFQSFFLDQSRARKAGLLFLTFLLALAVAAVQLVPSWDLVSGIERDMEESIVWSLQPIQLANVIFPDVFGNDRRPGHDEFWGHFLFYRDFPLYYSLYLGFGALFLVFFAFGKPWDKRRSFLVSVFVICTFLAFGKFSPLIVMLKNIPPFSFVRYPVKYFMGSVFSVALLSALGYDMLAARLRRIDKRLYMPLAFSTVCFGLFLLMNNTLPRFLTGFFDAESQSVKQGIMNAFEHGFIVLFVFAFFLFLCSVFSAKRDSIRWILIVLVLLDLFLVNRFINPVTSQSFFKKPAFFSAFTPPVSVYRDGFVPERLSGLARQRYFRQSCYLFTGIGEGIHSVYNPDFFDLNGKDYKYVFEHLRTCPEQDLIKILAAAGCGYYVGHRRIFRLEGTREDISGHPVYFQKIEKSLRFPHVVYESFQASSWEETFDLFVRPDFDPSKAAITGEGRSFRNGSVKKGRYRIVRSKETHGLMEYVIESDNPGLLIVKGSFHRGWRAWIDGADTKVLKVNLTSKGVIIPAGRHAVKLKFMPKSNIYGAFLSAFTLLALIGMGICTRLEKRKKARRTAFPARSG